jgi:hypothetical protein
MVIHGDNSILKWHNFLNLKRERQSQIEELTKELKKTQDEYEAIKYKLKGFKNKHGVKILI